MRKLLFFVVFFASMQLIYAQPTKVVSAYNFLKEGKLDKALENINAALTHPKTSEEVKTWLYKGNVMLAIALTDVADYKKLDPDPLGAAYTAYQKCIALDKDYIQPTANPPSAKLGLFVIGEQYYNRGVEKFNNGKFSEAIPDFEKTKSINNIFNIKDSLATYNAAICAIQINDNEKAITFLKELITMNYKNPGIYSYLANIYIQKKEFDRATQIIKSGRNRFPDDLNVLIAEINLYLATNDVEKAQKTLQAAVEKDPNNPILHFTIGTNYDAMLKNENITDADRQNFFSKAELAYQKAIELKSDYFDAYYNMGALFYNEGVRIFDLADKITDMKLYAKEKEKFDGMWLKAIPFLEKAHTLNPNDLPTLISLKTIYARLSKQDELKIVNEKIKAIQK